MTDPRTPAPDRNASRAVSPPAVWRRMLAATAALTLSVTLAHSAVADEIERGEQLAQRLCAVCHLNPGQGEKAGPGTVPGFVAVARRTGQTLEGIVHWLASVPPMMPDHKLSQDEMHALAFYILSLRDADPAPPAAAEPRSATPPMSAPPPQSGSPPKPEASPAPR